MKTAAQYIDSPGSLSLDLHLMGREIDNLADHPIIMPSINSVTMIYKLAHEEKSKDISATASTVSTAEMNRFTSLFTSMDNLAKKVKPQRFLGQRIAPYDTIRWRG